MSVPVLPLAEKVLADFLDVHASLPGVSVGTAFPATTPAAGALRLTTVSAPRPHVWESLSSVQIDARHPSGAYSSAVLAETVASLIPELGGAVTDGPRPIFDADTDTTFYAVTVQLPLLPETGGPDG